MYVLYISENKSKLKNLRENQEILKCQKDLKRNQI